MPYSAPNSFTEFRDWIRSGGAEPARSNLYSVFVGLPRCVRAAGFSEFRTWTEYVNFAADDVTVPSRQITTAQVKDFGMQRNYATGQVNSPITISFLVTKDLMMRHVFELWMNSAAGDQENRTSFYDQYTTNIIIQKWELGSNVVYKDHRDPRIQQRLNRCTGAWQMIGAFPTNISVMQLNNEATSLMKMDIEFSYERYRFDQVLENLGWANMPDKYIDLFTQAGISLGVLNDIGIGGDYGQNEVNDYGI